MKLMPPKMCSSYGRRILPGGRISSARSNTLPRAMGGCSMPASNPLHLIVREWVIKAEHDLANAAHTLTLGKQCPTDTVAFHAQQCAEKYIKAMLVLSGITVPKVHDLEQLVKIS